ncbi:MAG: ABC transporter permease [Dehalococcoidales bacterium]|nr:ABC transporter permease [Dehalococcoidales bacterium]
MKPTIANPAPQDSRDSAGSAAVLAPLGADSVGGMSLWEVVRESFESLLANKGRALLTMLGVIIGVASVVSLMALGSGATASVTGEIESIGTNLIFVSPAVPRGGGPGMTSMPETLTVDDARAISALGLPLNGVAPQFTGSAQIVAAAADKSAQVIGTTPDHFSLNDLRPASGTLFDEAQDRAAEPVVVLGNSLAKDLFGSGQAVGQTVRMKNQAVRVVGVLIEKGGGGLGSTDHQAFVPISFAQQRLFGARTPDGNSYKVGSILLSAKNSADIPAIQDRIAILLRERHHLKADGTGDDFLIVNQESFLSVLNNITSLLTAFLAAIAGISLVVGGIGIMNIMLVSVTERTKEIGLRKAVGARSRDILMQFVVEALAISLLGGVLGLALGALLALLVNLSGIIPATVSLESVLLAVGFSMGVGLFFGIYPARRASQLNPIDALRYE